MQTQKKSTLLRALLIIVLLLIMIHQNAFAKDAPSLSLKDSLPVAEKTIAQAKLDISNLYIFSIVYTHSSRGSYWYYTYRSASNAARSEVYLKIFMDGTTEVSGAIS